MLLGVVHKNDDVSVISINIYYSRYLLVILLYVPTYAQSFESTMRDVSHIVESHETTTTSTNCSNLVLTWLQSI